MSFDGDRMVLTSLRGMANQASAFLMYKPVTLVVSMNATYRADIIYRTTHS